MATPHEAALSSVGQASAMMKARIVRNLTMTPEAEEYLADLAQRMELSARDLLRLALGMFNTAADAKQQGKHVGVASTPDVLDAVPVGF